MTRFIVTVLSTVLLITGCAEPSGKPDLAKSNVKEQTDSTEDIEIITSIETKTFFSNDHRLDVPGYIYTAYGKGAPDYIFTIETYGKKRGYSTYLHLERYDPPSTTVIKGALYDNGMVHFVGTNGFPIWKYQYALSVFPRVNTAVLEEQSSEEGVISDIIPDSEGGYLVVINTVRREGTWYEPNLDMASVVQVADVHSRPKRQMYIRNIFIAKLLIYEGQLIVFGKKDNQLFFGRFYKSPDASWITETPIYYHDFPFKIIGVYQWAEFFYVRGITEDNVQTIKIFDNPYSP